MKQKTTSNLAVLTGVALATLFLAVPFLVLAQVVNPAPGFFVNFSNFGELLNRILQIALSLAAGVAVLFLIIGGFQYVTSRGNSEQMDRAKRTIISAVVGLIIIILSFAIVIVVSNLVTQGPGEMSTPPPTTPPSNGGNGGSGTGDGQNVAITSPAPGSTLSLVPGVVHTFELSANNCPLGSCAWSESGLRNHPDINFITVEFLPGGQWLRLETSTNAEIGFIGHFDLTATNTTLNQSDTQRIDFQIVAPAVDSP